MSGAGKRRFEYVNGSKPPANAPYSLTGKWTPAIEADLERMYAMHGKNYMGIAQIRDELNRVHKQDLTRNAVVGKSNRMGLDKKYPRSDPTQGAKRGRKVSLLSPRSVAYKNTDNPLGSKKVARIRNGPPVSPDEHKPTPEPVLVAGEGMPLKDAEDGNCKWPLGKYEGEDMCCGQPRFRVSLARPGSYCKAHLKDSAQPVGARTGKFVAVPVGRLAGNWT